MTKEVLFDAWNKEYKKPFGAVYAGRRIELKFPVLKTLKADKVVLVLRRHDVSVQKVLKKTEREGDYDVFRGSFTVKTAGITYYRFEIYSGETVYFCGRNADGGAIIGDWLPEWQLTVYEKGFHTPDWLKGGLIYHVFVDRFCHAGEWKQPEVGVLKRWDEDVTVVDPDGVYRANDFFGGNLKGITAMLPYLSEMFVTALYLSPVFASMSNHRYDTADYMKIDDLLGTEEDFEELIAKASEYGIGIILDGVFNHTGADSVYFNKFHRFPSLGAYESKQSPYYPWYTFTKFPDEYACWWGVTVVPTVNRGAIGFQNLIAGENGVIEKWTKMGVKGWRLDVVDELSTEFVEKIRERIKTVDPEAVVIGEVWEDASTKVSYGEERQYLFGKELDGVMNYPFKEAIFEYLREKDAEKFRRQVMTIIENYPKEVLDVSMSLIGTHDTVRALNTAGETYGEEFTKAEKLNFVMSKGQYENARKMLQLASAIQYFLPGVPSLYYGDEIGMQGFDDPINRRPFSSVWDMRLLMHYKLLGGIRANHRNAMKSDAEIFAEKGIVIIKRGVLKLAVNPTMHDAALPITVYDLLTKQYTSLVPSKTAIIWEE